MRCSRTIHVITDGKRPWWHQYIDYKSFYIFVSSNYDVLFCGCLNRDLTPRPEHDKREYLQEF